ncbi:MAG TPA: FUSC family protein [Chthoniobacterales bacterium]|nr:FUSC family protein [Chthoniobacterales bacterium]
MTEVEVDPKYTAHSSFADLPAKTFRRWRWPLQDVFSDPRVRSGIKFGLAALLALYIAEVLRLEHPDWAIFTVLSMMSVPYIGSISILAITQVLGATGGTLVGVWLVGDYASTPAIFLTVFFFVLAFAGYKFGQASASQVSLGYYLIGFMTIIVATSGLADPAQIWQTGINRVLESLNGAMSSLLVSALLWPRSARAEFAEARRSALNTLRKLFSAHMNAYLRRQKVSAEMEQIQEAFGERLTVLRNLLQAASRESTVFQARGSNHNPFLESAAHLFHLLLDLRRCELETSLLSRVEPELQAVAAAISEEFDILAGPGHPDEKVGSSRLHEAFTALEEKVSELREHFTFTITHLQERSALYRGFTLLRSVHHELNKIRALVRELPSLDQPASELKCTFALRPTIDWFWIKTGVKASLAASIAILLIMWINPPGASVIPFVAWQLTIFRRPSLRAGGTGDLRGFQNGFLAALVLAACVFLLILATPFLVDYPVMNLALFLMMFVFGFMTTGHGGINFWMQIWWLIIFVIVGLNPQQPVPTPAIIDNFVGFVTGMTIATVLGRLIWPVLPQMVVRDNLLAVFRHISALLDREPHREKIQNQLAILPTEALQASRQISIAGCTPREKARLGALIRALQTLATRTLVLVSERDALPEIAQAVLRPLLERLELEFKQMLDAFAECLRQGDCRRALPRLNGVLSKMLQGQYLEESSVSVLKLVNHYHATAEALEECRRLMGTLQIHRYWGHCGL